jgi:hypothetical protein
MASPEFYVAKESANFDFEGQPVFLTAGVTIVRAGHPILANHQQLFEPIRVHYDMPKAEQPEVKHQPVTEQVTTDSPVNPVRADQRGARTRSRAE